MLTAYAEVGMSEKCLEAGGDGYMTKPIKINELLAELAKYGLIRN
jgi:CheY-like chemotaxis protein